MKITVAGVGYVGLSLAVLLAQKHEVTAITTTEAKAEKLNRFISPIQDDEIERFFEEAREGKRTLNLHTTTDKAAAYGNAELVIIATPTNYDDEHHFFDVTILDVNLKRLEELDNMFGAHIQTLYSSDSNIEKSVMDADLVIGSVLIPGGSTPKLFKKKYLPEMKDGAVFVDVAIDQGGCGESSHVTTHDDPVYIDNGVVHYCVGNMPGAVPRTSTIALTNATLRYGLRIAKEGLETAAKTDNAILTGVNCYNGKLVNKNVADAHGYEYTDLMTLIG